MEAFRVFLLCFLLAHTTFANDDDYDYASECSTSETIEGGMVEYSDQGSENSVLTYRCPPGMEPFPVSTRTCQDGEWTRITSGRPECKKVETTTTTDEYDYEEEEFNCTTDESISNGHVSYSNGGLRGSVLTYSCPVHYIPYPVSQRVCGPDGEWSSLRQPGGGRPVSRATCKEIQCPAQLQLANGDMSPRQQWFKVGENQTFSCHSGFSLRGAAERTCTEWGGWTGETPTCEDEADDCLDPGVPPGARRVGGRFRVGDKVVYRCDLKMELLGSEERECLESREWSGAPARCQAWYGFDSPDTVAQAMGGSLSSLMDYSSPEFKKKAQGFGRSIQIHKGRLNVFILMDTSGSITTKVDKHSRDHFEESRNAVASLITKLDSYEVTLKFHIISFASTARVIAPITSIESDQASLVLNKLMKFKYDSHGRTGTGTNIQSALKNVYEQLSLLKARDEQAFKDTPNVILITTDGHSNTGGSPKAVLSQIRDLFNYTSKDDHTAESLLDVYVFGVGETLNKKELNGIASKKKGEDHVFILQGYKQLGKVFNEMISDKAVSMCGVAWEEVEDRHLGSDQGQPGETRPWHVNVNVNWNTGTCQGSLLSPSWVLTAAHCLSKPTAGGNTIATPDKVSIRVGNSQINAAELVLHPQYDVKGLRFKKVKEFYDYDIALIKLEKNVSVSQQARPVCLPCTVPSSRALKMVNSTCAQHESTLLGLSETQAHFFSRTRGQNTMKKMQTHIQLGAEKRPECIEKAKGTFSQDTTAAVTEVVTERFLCTGGTTGHTDAVSCPGDSGGSLFLRKGMRYFQVGVLSWGTVDLCKSNKDSGKPPPNARDFHISVFSLMPWLRKHLSQDLAFLPADN
ncbi:complement C2 [Engraulis encrasicolus]|uniref:complement C2 n=1 Tax=Engraulis encrasicolus TaxID=184585 RepID=UPI002FCED702